MKVIDISRWNGEVDWAKAARECEGVILRCGFRGYGSGGLVTDERFKENIKGARKAGLPCGVYFVTQAITEKEAEEEARYTLKLIKGYKLELPVFIDSENCNEGRGRADAGKLGRNNRTKILNRFCEVIDKAGFTAGVYASDSWLANLCDMKVLDKWFIWVAKYSTKKPTVKYEAWQYTDRGKVTGVSSAFVDFSEFPSITKPVKKTTRKKSIETIAKEVIDGKWGNGDERKAKLEKAGYSYKKVQEAVNKLLKK